MICDDTSAFVVGVATAEVNDGTVGGVCSQEIRAGSRLQLGGWYSFR
ncbi:hypothetical protein ACFPJ1_06685 [Kribbella qitaiheensis]